MMWGRVLLGLLLVLLPSSAYGEPCERAAYVEASERAPCEGTIVPSTALARLLSDSDRLELVRAQLEAAEARLAAEIEAAEARLELERSTRLECEEVVAPVLRPRAWWESPWLWLTVGLGVGVATTYAITR